jgi:hypothetical protein
MTRPDYQTRYRQARRALTTLSQDPEQVLKAVNFSTAQQDQMLAAGQESRSWIDRTAHVLSTLKSDQFGNPTMHTGERSAYIDSTARVLAAMSDGRPWPWCPHLLKNPAQPGIIALALRRIYCQRCARTNHQPPPDESDRCDLCGSRGNSSFWPVMFTMSAYVVIGDTCRPCAEALHALAGAPLRTLDGDDDDQ